MLLNYGLLALRENGNITQLRFAITAVSKRIASFLKPVKTCASKDIRVILTFRTP